MRILHFGDIHIWRLKLESDFWYLKRVLGWVNLAVRRRFKFPPEYAPLVASEIVKQEADVVIFSGDMSTMSLDREFEVAAELFQPIREKWGARFFCIPGNHDRYSPGSVSNRLYEKHFPYGAFEDGALVRSMDIKASDVSIVGFDCSHPCKVRSNGTITMELERQLREELERLRGTGRRVLLVGHYPFAYPKNVHASWEHKLLEADRLGRLIEEFRPLAYFHGHKHVRWVLRDSGTACINCGAAGMRSEDAMKQAGFVMLDYDEASGEIGSVEARILKDAHAGRFESVPVEES